MDWDKVSLIVGVIALTLGVISIVLEDFNWAIILFIAGYSNLIMSKLGNMEDKFKQEIEK